MSRRFNRIIRCTVVTLCLKLTQNTKFDNDAFRNQDMPSVTKTSVKQKI